MNSRKPPTARSGPQPAISFRSLIMPQMELLRALSDFTGFVFPSGRIIRKTG